MGRDVVEAFTLAFRSTAGGPLACGVQIVVVFKFVVAETLGLRPNHFALKSFGVFPAKVQSVFAFLGNWE